MTEPGPDFATASQRCQASHSPILRVAARGLAPLIQIIGLYVYFHGHYSPGGGFQGGALLAASFILLRLGLGHGPTQLVMPSRLTIPLSALGGLIFIGTGFLALASGGNFMDYSYLPIAGLKTAYVHNYAILFIEVGVMITVMATLIAIFDHLLDG